MCIYFYMQIDSWTETPKSDRYDDLSVLKRNDELASSLNTRY